MADESKPVEVAAENKNAASEQDVQNVLAELKAGETGKEAETAAPVAAEKKETEVSNGEKAVSEEKKTEDANAEAEEEARIIAAAQKLGQDAVGKEDQKQDNRGQDKKRVNYRENIKSDFTTLEETSDPVEIRKQVGSHRSHTDEYSLIAGS